MYFKQKTAYEMRMSDWSSDVCSSDLRLVGHLAFFQLLDCVSKFRHVVGGRRPTQVAAILATARIDRVFLGGSLEGDLLGFDRCSQEIGRASCRERVCKYV